MKAEIRQKLVSLYWIWCGQGRDDYGVPLSLGDFVHHAKWYHEECARGNRQLFIAGFADSFNISVGFAEELGNAIDAGISESEMLDLCDVRAPCKLPPTRTPDGSPSRQEANRT